MWPIALGFGLLLFGLFGTVIVCSRMNDPLPLPDPLGAPAHRADPEQTVREIFET
jgi:hypothetical protein